MIAGRFFLAVTIGVLAGAGMMRAYDRSHIAPIIIGQTIPGVPCSITDEGARDCLFSVSTRRTELSSSVRIGSLTIMQAPVGIEPGHEYQKDEYGGLHQMPPPPTY
jgi:hypothetical protein